MIFSSLLFLYVFLPAVLAVVLLAPRTWHNYLLLIASLIFYAWGGVSYSVLLLISIGINYFVGRAIDRHRGTPLARWSMIVGVVLNLLLLGIFKYANLLVGSLDVLLTAVGWTPIELKPIALPIGISFFTFQAISYIVDVYDGKASVEKRIANVGLYIALFPQLIAGPIVRYREIAQQIVKREMSWAKMSYGIERFVWGLGKKVLLANTFAVLADDIFAIQAQNLDPLTAWVGLAFYTLQLYFDFSGYSDMAIGLGSMLGFRIPENFNFPYISRSIREFWRRWHITLSMWFRDYVYIKMGGSRRSVRRTYFNLFVVFVLVGLWHGAAWTFVVFGLIHGIFMVLERIGLERLLARTWRPVAHVYTMLVFMLSLVVFRTRTIHDSLDYLGAMTGSIEHTGFRFDLGSYFGIEMWIMTGIGLLACTPVFRTIHRRALQIDRSGWQRVYTTAGVIATLFVFLYCTMNLSMGTYNPFIYYQF
ncbi:MAG: MBOAT family protein [Saprospiraceae bacterium]|nr:MBOAT family protein [Saprospiraceae bacterium]